MIAEYLDRKLVLQQLGTQRDFLVKLRKLAGKKDRETLAALRRNKITVAQLDRAIAALKTALAAAKKDRQHPAGSPFIPRDPVTCGMQAGLTQLATEHGKTEARAAKKSAAPARRAAPGVKRAKAADTSPPLKLKRRPGVPATAAELRRAAFVEGDDFHYGVDGFFAKFGALFKKKRPFNNTAARVVSSPKPLRLYVFGDWGTGLPLADAVRRRIEEQVAAAADGTRAQHVIHLGDVYYVGDAEEYIERVFPFWPVPPNRWKQVGSWSLNGNHDMYNGGHGYFDTLLANDPFRAWHADAAGKPSSFFLIEDAHWQVFGLDTSWNTPPLSAVPFGQPTKEDYGGMNGIITNEQATWMAAKRNRAKGCILLTHHQPAASRTSEKQHADETVALLRKVKVYDSIDAWIWGHEHRAVVFRPRAARTDARLKGAPDFCACIGHGGVPVTDKNFEADKTIADVLWQEDGRGVTRPVYEKESVMPFGFARLETRSGAFDFRVFDHDGNPRYATTVNRTT